jgi:predicted component of type VI protein secretion system
MSDTITETKPEETVYTEVTQTNGQVENRVWVYKITNIPEGSFKIAVIAVSATIAKEGLRKQLPSTAIISYLEKADKIIQCQ